MRLIDVFSYGNPGVISVIFINKLKNINFGVRSQKLSIPSVTFNVYFLNYPSYFF